MEENLIHIYQANRNKYAHRLAEEYLDKEERADLKTRFERLSDQISNLAAR